MILLFILVLAVTVGGIVWLRAAWIRIDQADTAHREAITELHAHIRTVEQDLADRLTVLEMSHADLRAQITEYRTRTLNELTVLDRDLNGLLAFFADESFAPAFRATIGQTFRMKLPDALKLRLGAIREG